MSWYITGMKTAGRKLAILISVISSILKEIPIISRLPITLISFITVATSTPFSREAHNVITPWYINTDIDDNATPIPRDDANTTEVTPSKTDFA